MSQQIIFLASSAELEEDRRAFEIFVNRKNKEWHNKDIFIRLEIWEDFLDAMSATRLQDEYNKAVKSCDMFVLLFFSKVGKYTEEEFETAFGQFKKTQKPFIFTYFKEGAVSTDEDKRQDLMSLWAFQEKLKGLGHFYKKYKNVEDLQLKFNQQLDKLVSNGFIQFDAEPETDSPAGKGGSVATVTGNENITIGTTNLSTIHIHQSNKR